MNHSLLSLEQGVGGEEAIGSIFRSVHTIKGMSATMGYTAVATLSHALETVLDAVRRGTRRIDGPLMELLFQSADVLERAVEGAVEGRSNADEAEWMAARLSVDNAPANPAPVNVAVAGPSDAEWTAAAPDGDGLLVRVRLRDGTP